MITIKTPKEIDILREGGKKLASILHQVAKAAVPGTATIELDSLAEKLIRENKGEPSFKNYTSDSGRTVFPASLCVAINDEVVHGIPSADKILKEGDIVGLDVGMKYKGLYTDIGITVPVGKISDESQQIIDITKKSLDEGIKVIKENVFAGDIGFAIQKYAEERGFGVVRNLVGHGVGYAVHEKPEIPNFGQKRTGAQLKAGMVLALEPMITRGSFDITLDKDRWTWRTSDGSLSAHFEHTVVVTKNGSEILTKI